MIGGAKSKKRDKESFDDLHRCLVINAERQSKRDFPHMSIRNGITDGTKMGSAERVGNCFVLLSVMHTYLGKELMATKMKQMTIPMRGFINCLKLYLAYERWVTEPHSRAQVCRSYKLLGELITMIKQCFPRGEGWGRNLPKMHAFAIMPSNIMKFGSANNFSGNIGERALKGIVKDHADKTQRRPDKFAEQCAIREHEKNSIKYVMTDMSNSLGASKSCAPRQNEMIELEGRFTVHISATNNRGIGREEDKIVWHDKEREKMTFKVADLFLFAIRRFSHSHGYTDEFKVTGYTTFKVNNTSSEKTVTYYATEYMNGEKRYDYTMIVFLSDDGLSATSPAMILGFP